jgi:transposase
MVLFVGNDWAEDHHDVEVQDATGRRLGKARLPEGVTGIARLHALVGEFADPEDPAGAGQVLVGIETDRGPWVAALVAAGYRAFAINPVQVARYRERHSTSGAKSDAGDAHVLADMVRTDAHQLRAVAGDSDQAERSKSWLGRIRHWSGIGPGTCCGCGRRCGSSSPPRLRPSPT